ncbi:MAG: hypothetical protein QM767_24040 [Anaeromyxobacter sp.]
MPRAGALGRYSPSTRRGAAERGAQWSWTRVPGAPRTERSCGSLPRSLDQATHSGETARGSTWQVARSWNSAGPCTVSATGVAGAASSERMAVRPARAGALSAAGGTATTTRPQGGSVSAMLRSAGGRPSCTES